VPHSKHSPLVLSVFTGAGGLDLGLERAGFRTILAIERDPSARETIKRNREQWNLSDTGDVTDAARDLRPRDLGLRKKQLGLLVGGPPCQPFSKAAQWADRSRAGLADSRSKCLDAFLDLAEHFLPRAILIENVTGFVRGRTSAVPTLETALDGINDRNSTNYKLEWRVLNALQYGVPQRRYRAILVATRDGSRFAWPTPSHKSPIRAYDALRGITILSPPRRGGYWSGLLPSIPEGSNYLFHTADGGGLPIFGRRRKFWSFLLKLAKDQPAWTIQARPGPATGPFHWDNRPLAVKELLRLQTFPAKWVIRGGIGAQVRQIGNATPPLLAEVIGRALGSQLFGLSYDKRPSLTIARSRSEPRRTRPRPVPMRYLMHLNTQDEHPGEGLGPGALRRSAEGR